MLRASRAICARRVRITKRACLCAVSWAINDVALRREVEDRAGIGAALNNLGNVARAQGDAQAAGAYYEESLSVRRELGDLRGATVTLNQLGQLVLSQEEFSRAATLW